MDKDGPSFRGVREVNGGDGGGDNEGRNGDGLLLLFLYLRGVMVSPLLSFDGPIQTIQEPFSSPTEFDLDLYDTMISVGLGQW